MKPRLTFLAFACLLAALLLTADVPSPLYAGKKSNSEENQLRQALQKLQNELREREQTLRQLQQQLKDKDNKINQLQASLKKADSIDSKQDKEIERLRQSAKELDALKRAKYVHTVILRLK